MRFGQLLLGDYFGGGEIKGAQYQWFGNKCDILHVFGDYFRVA